MSVKRIAVLGAGTMGHGIAQVAAAAGFGTLLFDAEPDRARTGLQQVRSNLDGGVARGKLTEADRDAALARLRPAASLADAVGSADLVIEAVPEQLDLKQSLFAAVDSAAPEQAILATNTSSLSVSRIASATSRPDRVVGLHFFNPVHLMLLLEVVRGEHTSDRTISAALDVAARLGKEPIVVSDTPGFASSRLGVVIGLEAMRMLEQGVATAAEIDRAMELGYRHPMGPLRLSDLVGLDVRLGIAEYLYAELGGEQYRPPEILRQRVAQGALGKKAGRGFYDWPAA